MKKVLISGFEPFGGEHMNPSIEAVKRLPDVIDDFQIIKVEIPTAAIYCEKEMLKHIEKHQPDYVIDVGQAAGRSNITLERVAINIDNFSIKDNGGQLLVDVPIKSDGADGYFSNLDIKRLVNALRQAGYPASVSNSAGTFVCNHIMYCMQYARHTQYPHLKCGFVHIPCLPQQCVDKNVPSMTLECIVSALQCLIANLEVSDGKNHC